MSSNWRLFISFSLAISCLFLKRPSIKGKLAKENHLKWVFPWKTDEQQRNVLRYSQEKMKRNSVIDSRLLKKLRTFILRQLSSNNQNTTTLVYYRFFPLSVWIEIWIERKIQLMQIFFTLEALKKSKNNSCPQNQNCSSLQLPILYSELSMGRS
jgi:hypothetical protein